MDGLRLMLVLAMMLNSLLLMAESAQTEGSNETTQDLYNVTITLAFKAINRPDPRPVYLTFQKNESKTAFDILLTAQNRPCYNLNYTINPKYGAFITSICGVNNNDTAKYYWMFFVNGKLSRVGVSSYDVKPNDVIKMQYMHVDTGSHSDTYNITLKVVFDVSNKPDPSPVHLTFRKSESKTAFDILLAAQNRPCYNLNYTIHSKYGAFITSICGVKNNNTANYYWMFFVNGKLAPVGVSSYDVKPNDVIKMQYMYVDPGSHSDTYNITLRVVFDVTNKQDPGPVHLTFHKNESKTAFDILLAAQNRPCYNLNYTIHSKYGAFITSICGVKNNNTANYYWMFFVNGKLSPVGVSSYDVKPNDVIKMQYMYVDPGSHSDTYDITLKVVFDVSNKPDPSPVHLTFHKNESKTAFDILLAAQNRPCYNLNYTIHSKYGAFITSICGVKNNNTANYYWMFFVNGKLAPVGVSSYDVKPNDVIKMQYMYVDPGSHSDTYNITLRVVFDVTNKQDPGPVHLTFHKNESKTAFDILLAAQNRPCYNLNYTIHSKYGAFITSICGVKNNNTANYYWMFFVNGKLSPVGVSSYDVKPNDVIKMQYMYVDPGSHSDTYDITLKVVFDVSNKPDPSPVHLTFRKNESKTAFDILLAAQNRPCYNLNYTIHSKYGAFITSICGVKNNNTANYYWIFFVNGKLSPVGVSSYDLKPNDVIKMQYMYVDPGSHSDTYNITLRVVFDVTNKKDPSPVHLTFLKNESKTAFDILLAAQNRPCYNLNYTIHSKYGAFITSICGVKNNNTAKYYWMFFVNGKLSPVGVSSYDVKPNDEIKMQYMYVDPGSHSDTYDITLKVVFDVSNKPDPSPVHLTFRKNESKTAFDILLAAQNRPCYNLNYTIHSKYGAFITSICGVKNNNTANYYWMFFVNGKLAPVGVSSYDVKPNDVIKMQYMYVDPGSHSDTYNITLRVVFDVTNKKDPGPVHITFLKNESKTAFDVLVAAQQRPCYNFDYKNYSNNGTSITSFCDVKNNITASYYWVLFANGKKILAGVFFYQIKPNDSIEIRYMYVDRNSVSTIIPSSSSSTSAPSITAPSSAVKTNFALPYFVSLVGNILLVYMRQIFV